MPPRPPSSNNKKSSTTGVASVLKNFDRYDSWAENDDANDARTTTGSKSSGIYPFTPKFLKSVQNNPLCGITLGGWIRLVWKRHDQMDFVTFWPRLVFLTVLATLNSSLAMVEYWCYEAKIQSTELPKRPVFVIGHPRTGTTLMHSLLALDESQFGIICTTFCAGFPSCFLWLERIGKVLFKNVIAETRPMDNVPLHFDLPQEDELATNILCASHAVSPYMPLWFMVDEPSFRPYYAFADVDDDNDNDKVLQHIDEHLPSHQMAQARKTWTEAFLYLLRKLTLRAQLRRTKSASTGRLQQEQQQQQWQQQRLLLKSPVHTARIRLLRQLFPDAQFIYMHRHPYDVFRSAAHMADTTYWYTYLQVPSNDQIQEFILRQYEILWDRYQTDKEELLLSSSSSSSSSGKDLVEVGYDELAQNPLATIEKVYQDLGWKLTDEYRMQLQQEIGSRASYQVNQHKPLPKSIRQIIDQRWGPSFAVLGYAKEEEEEEE